MINFSITLQQVLLVYLNLSQRVPLLKDLALEEVLTIFVVDDLIGFSFSEGVINIFDGFKAKLPGILGEVEVQLLSLAVGFL